MGDCRECRVSNRQTYVNVANKDDTKNKIQISDKMIVHLYSQKFKNVFEILDPPYCWVICLHTVRIE